MFFLKHLSVNHVTSYLNQMQNLSLLKHYAFDFKNIDAKYGSPTTDTVKHWKYFHSFILVKSLIQKLVSPKPKSTRTILGLSKLFEIVFTSIAYLLILFSHNLNFIY